jgi:Skp family chaperone for outer membrane proteins
MTGRSTEFAADFSAQLASPLDPNLASSSSLLPPNSFQDPLNSALNNRSSLNPVALDETQPFVRSFEPASVFQSGWFTVGSAGQVSIDYLYDGGLYEGDVGIFSLAGLEDLAPGSTEFMQTVVQRVLSNSTLGHLIISDQTEGARFDSTFNADDYLGVKTFAMNAGDRFGMVLVPNGTFFELAQNPTADGSQRPLFSLSTANPIEGFQFGQIADVTGNGSTFVFEDLRVDGHSDRDYEDIMLQIRGAIGFAPNLDEMINPGSEWRNSTMGQAILNYIAPYDNPMGNQSGDYQFAQSNQPLIGIIDTGFAANNPDIDYSRITLGRDYVDGDTNPLLPPGEGNEHGTHILGIIGATQNNGIGINGINDQAPIWLGRAIGSGKWAESLVEFVDTSRNSGQRNAVVNLSFDLTQKNSDGSVTTRYEFTPWERQALEYARQNGVLIVAASGNDGGTMSALGQASQEFDNIITVGSIDYNSKHADYSSFGYGLDLVAYGGTLENPVISTMGNATGLKRLVEDLGLQWDGIGGDLKNQNTANQQVATSDEASGLFDIAENEAHKGITNWALFDGGSAETSNEVDENLLSDEMAANAHQVFADVFGEFSDSDESELENLTPEERQIYEETTQEIDQFLSDYLEAASQKLALEYVDGYYETQVEALSQFVDAFDENMAETLLKAQELLQEEGFNIELPQEASKDTPLDFGLGGMAGTSTAAAKVTGVVSQVWAANPNLSYAQIKDILKRTATDLNTPGWDKETGAGKVNLAGSISLAKATHPEAYQPQPIISPLVWSGEGKVVPSERPVEVSQYKGKYFEWGTYTVVSGDSLWAIASRLPGLSGPDWPFIYERNRDVIGSNPSSIRPGQVLRIPIENPNYLQQQEQERQQQEAIRRAEEEARRAEEAMRQAEEEARQAEEELRRIEAEQRRIQEEQRLRQEAFQALVNGITQKYGDPGLLMGSWVSNGVTVYQFAKGQLLIKPDGSLAFYEAAMDTGSFLKDQAVGKISDPKFWIKDIGFAAIGEQGKLEWVTKHLGSKAFSEAVLSNPVTKVFRYANAQTVGRIDDLILFKKHMAGAAGFGLPRFNSAQAMNVAKNAKGGMAALGFVLDLAMLVPSVISEDDPTKQRDKLVVGLAGAAGGATGAVLGGALASFIPIPGATFVGSMAGYAAGKWLGEKGAESILSGSWTPLTQPFTNAFDAVSSFTSDAIEAAKQKAQAAQATAQAAIEKAKNAYQNAKTTVQQAQIAYQTFKQEVQKQTQQIVQKAEQKVREAAQSVMQKVINNSIIQAGSRVINQVSNYAKKAFNAVTTVINGAKQFVNNVIQTGKQIVNNIVETGKQAYQQVSNFVSEKVEQGKQFAADTYNKVSQAASTVTNFVSGGFNGMKSMFGW